MFRLQVALPGDDAPAVVVGEHEAQQHVAQVAERGRQVVAVLARIGRGKGNFFGSLATAARVLQRDRQVLPRTRRRQAHGVSRDGFVNTFRA
jgi:hypothetical protein